MQIKNWGYGETQWGTTDKTQWRREVRYVGRMSKNAFINTILNGESRGRKWILDRMCNTGNDFELELITKHPDKVVCYDDRTHEILQILDKW